MSGPLTLTTHSEVETRQLGIHLGKFLEPGDVVALLGDLGAGKTQMAKGIAEGLGVPNAAYVNSPTFTLLQVHHGRVPMAHLDWYRLEGPEDFDALGWEDLGSEGSVVVIEWAERHSGWWEREPGVTVRLVFGGGDVRQVILEPRGPRGEEILKKWLMVNG